MTSPSGLRRATGGSACESVPGRRLHTADGITALVGLVFNHRGAQSMRALTVDTIRTFYVETGTTPTLVHGGMRQMFSPVGEQVWNAASDLYGRMLDEGEEVAASQPVGLQHVPTSEPEVPGVRSSPAGSVYEQ